MSKSWRVRQTVLCFFISCAVLGSCPNWIWAESSTSTTRPEADLNITIKVPSEGQDTIAADRDFYVIGNFSEAIPEDSKLVVDLVDEHETLCRHLEKTAWTRADDMYLDYADLLYYGENRADFSASLMPDLVYDPKDVASFRDSYRKIAFDAFSFAALISGTQYKRDTNLQDEQDQNLAPLQEGKYQIRVSLYDADGTLRGASQKDIVLGQIEHRIAARFSPAKHLDLVKAFAKKQGYHLYLDPFPGNWFPADLLNSETAKKLSGEIAPKWRFADAYEYDGPKTSVLLYNITNTCATYAVEIGRLNHNGYLDQSEHVDFYYYDTGDAYLGQDKNEKLGSFLPFPLDQSLLVTRVDYGEEKAPEESSQAHETSTQEAKTVATTDAASTAVIRDAEIETEASALIYDPALIDVTRSDFDLSDGVLCYPNRPLIIQGVFKPIKNTEIQIHLNDDETYTLDRYVAEIHYELCSGSQLLRSFDAPAEMTRRYGEKEQKSILEFRNQMLLSESELKQGNLKLKLTAYDNFGELIPQSSLEFELKKADGPF